MLPFKDWVRLQKEALTFSMPEAEEEISASPVAPPKKAPTKPETEPDKPEKRNPWRPQKPKVVPQPKQGGPGVLPRKAPVKPETSPKPEKRNPWRPQKPKVVPQPKQSSYLLEQYEEEAHPDVQEFWQNFPHPKNPEQKHLFAQNPLMRLYGKEYAKRGFETASKAAEEAGLGKSLGDISQNTMEALHQILQLERNHEYELEEIARKVTSEIWGVPMEMLEGEIVGPNTSEVEQNPVREEPGDQEDYESLPPEVQKQIQKRVTLNALAHGGAMHSLYSAHHLAKKYLEQLASGGKEWAKTLMSLYGRLAPGIHKPYWLFSVSSVMTMLTSAKVGSARVEYKQNEEPEIVSKGIAFPVLVHELSKGVMELLSHHGLSNLDEPTAKNVVRFGDRAIDEMWLLQVGRDLWKKFLDALKSIPNKPPMSEILTSLYSREPDEVHEILMAVLDDSKKASDLLKQLVLEEPGDTDWIDDNDEEDPADWWKK